MGEALRTPRHVKYRRESGFGLVYEHDGYGYDDASLYEVSERVVDVLEELDDAAAERAAVEREFGEETVARLLEMEVLERA